MRTPTGTPTTIKIATIQAIPLFPGAVEVCDGADNDCDAIVDSDAVDASVWYVDRDGDGYGDDTTAYTSCEQPGTEWVSEGADCDDLRNDISPGQDEVCDTIDNNCDGLIDDASSVDAQTFYADTDKDGFGDPGPRVRAAPSSRDTLQTAKIVTTWTVR